MKELFKNRILLICLGGLLVGQVLYLVGFGALYILALVATLALTLPYPKIINSVFARFVIAVLLSFSFIALAAVVQLFIAPQSDFVALSLICTAFVVVAALLLNIKSHDKPQGVFTISDFGAVITGAFFVIPMAYIFFAGGPGDLTTFGATQSQDGMAHNVALSEMGGAQHLTYLTNPTYYPKGFHIADAMFLNAFGLHQADNEWTTNARVFAAHYLVFGFLLACVLYYAARQFIRDLVQDSAKNNILLALILGPALSLFYLIPFAHQGFLNFYYICAAIICGLLFASGFKLNTVQDKWFVAVYFMFGFGVTMSWGPIFLPVLFLLPVFYLLTYQPNILQIIKQLLSKYLPVVLGMLLLLVPLYLHFRFASENAFNAYGAIRSLNYGVLLAGLVLVGVFVFSKKSTQNIKDFVFCAIMPMFLLVGLLIAAQYFLVGEARYYSIKTSYLLEMLILACAAGGLLFAINQSKIPQIQQWILAPTLFGMICFMLIAVNTNPLQAERNMAGRPMFFAEDVQKITELGVAGELKSSNNLILHYNQVENKVYANPLIANWANGLVKVNEGNPTSAACISKVFTSFAYGTGSAQEQKEVIEAIKVCVKDRTDQGKQFYIITDPESKGKLIELLGNKATFL